MLLVLVLGKGKFKKSLERDKWPLVVCGRRSGKYAGWVGSQGQTFLNRRNLG